VKKLFLFALILLLSFSLFGCVDRENDAQLKQEGQPNSSNWEVISRARYSRGTITNLEINSKQVQSVTIEVEKNYQAGADPVDNPNFPFKPGEIVTFRLSNQIPQSKIPLKKEDRVIVFYAQYALEGEKDWFWGGDVHYYQKNGKYYDMNGNIANDSFARKVSFKDGKLIEDVDTAL